MQLFQSFRGIFPSPAGLTTERIWEVTMKKIQGESRLTFFEATSIIVGHGVGSGILSVPFLAAHNSLREILLIVTFC